VDQLIKPVTHGLRPIEDKVSALNRAADRDCDAIEVGHHREHVQVGYVIAKEDGTTTSKGRACHQFAYRGTLIETRLLDFNH
jgi:hypothetical protein